MKLKFLIFSLLILHPSLFLSAERFNRLNEDQGLSSRRCFAVCQDRKGLIWIANKFAIDRYDGRQIIRYELLSPDQQTPDNIGVNFVRLSPDSTVWAFTQSGSLYRYDEFADSFRFIYSIKSFYNSFNIILNDIFFDNNNTLLLATGKGVLKLDVDTKEASDCRVVTNTDVYHIAREAGLYYFATKAGLFTARLTATYQAKIMHHLLQNLLVNRIYYDPKFQQFWIGTFSDGIFLLSKKKNESPRQIIPQITKPVRAIIPYSDNQMAVGVDGEGVLLINRKSLLIEQSLIQIDNQPYSVSGNSVWDLWLDKQKILWIATYHEGISFSDHSTLKFNSLIHERKNPNSIASNYINAVIEDRDGDLWFGTSNGLSLYRRKSGQWTHYFQGSNLSEKNVILSLCESTDGKIWAGGYAFGVAEIDKFSGNVTRYHAGIKSTIIGTDYVYAIYKDEFTDNLWIGGIYGQISCFNPKTRQAHIYGEESLRCFSSYDESSILLGLYRGLYLLDKNTGSKKKTKINATVNAILKDGDRSYWIGTMLNGLYHYDMKSGRLSRYTKDVNGLSSNHIYAIEKDEEGFLWISTEDGLNKFSPQTGQVISYDKQDGLISNLYIIGASTRCSNSEIIFGSADGAVLFYPSEIKKNKNKEYYHLLFTGFSLFGNPVKAGEKGSPLKLPLNITEKIVLPYNKNYFSISFTLPNYQLSDKTRYSYFLKGYDLSWSVPANVTSAFYSKMQPGKYTFIVRVYIDRQLHEERQIIIVVNQPWWNSVWAWIIYVLFFLLGVYSVLRYYAERTRKKQTQEKMEFFINTAHDILTPLSLIEAPLKDMSFVTTLTDEAKYLLSLALNNTRKLSSFVYQLIDFQKITLNTSNLQVRLNNVQNFFTKKANDYRPIASQKFVTMDVLVPDTPIEILFDVEKINKILDNLLSNAIKYTPFGGKIEIMVTLSENDWSFKIKDTGIGIPKKDQHLIFKYIFREENDINSQNVGSGVGLKMAHALVRIHQGRITFNSKKGEGTEFQITLPYNYDEKYVDFTTVANNQVEFARSDEKDDARLFVVVSDSEVSSYLANMLSREYKVDTYNTGTEACAQVTRLQPGLILVDYKLADMDGYSFCRRIKENADTSHISVVLITDYQDQDNEKRMLSAGVADFIHKPFEPEIIGLRIFNLMNLQQVWQNKALADIKKNNITAINNDRDQEFMDNLIQFIEQNIDNPDLNISLLCKELALSRTLLYNRITQLTGNSPNEFIRIMRLKNAASLLISGKYTIAEVSTMVGIDNPKYFSRIFKDYYKVAPKNYLKEL